MFQFSGMCFHGNFRRDETIAPGVLADRSVRPFSEIIGATFHAQRSKVAPLPPLHALEKNRSDLSISELVGATWLPGTSKKYRLCWRALSKEIESRAGNYRKKTDPQSGALKIQVPRPSRGPDKAAERHLNGSGFGRYR